MLGPKAGALTLKSEDHCQDEVPGKHFWSHVNLGKNFKTRTFEVRNSNTAL